MGYELLGFLTESATITAEELVDLLRQKYASGIGALVNFKTVALNFNGSITVTWADWSIGLAISDAAWVVLESEEIAERYAKHRADQSHIARCRRRIEVVSDDDPSIHHFNNYVSIVEVLEAVPGCIVFDSRIGKFMDDIAAGR